MTRLAIHWQILIAMLLAVLAGVAVKLLFGTRRLPELIAVPAQSLQVLGMDRPARVSAGKFWSQDEPQRVLIQWEPAPAKEGRRFCSSSSVRRCRYSGSPRAGSALGQGAWATSPLPPWRAQISSARCGVNGAISCASARIASACARAPALDFISVLVKA